MGNDPQQDSDAARAFIAQAALAGAPWAPVTVRGRVSSAGSGRQADPGSLVARIEVDVEQERSVTPDLGLDTAGPDAEPSSGQTGSSVIVDATRWANRRLRHAGWLRRAAISGYRGALSLVRVLPPPRMFLNGHPKTGTHLLSDAVALMPRTLFSGRRLALSDFLVDLPEHADPAAFFATGTIDVPRLRRFVRRCPPGMFATGHVPYRAEVERILDEAGMRHVLLLRDPRDAAVSHVHFVMRHPDHYQHDVYARQFADDAERLLATIRGFSSDPALGPQIPSLAETWAGYVEWSRRPGVLVTRFEDLIDPERQVDEVRRIGTFLGRPLGRTAAARIADGMYSSKSFTFRTGAAGNWPTRFEDRHRTACKEVLGDLLIELGYEDDHEW